MSPPTSAGCIVIMLQALAPQDRTRTLVFLAICGVAAIAAVLVGISDNPPGILLAFTAAAAFVLAIVHPWRTRDISGGSSSHPG